MNLVESNYLHRINLINGQNALILNFLAQVSYSQIQSTGSRQVFIPKDTLEAFIFPNKETISDYDLSLIKSTLHQMTYIDYNPYEMDYKQILYSAVITEDGLELKFHSVEGLYYLCQYMLEYLKEYADD